jgi:hypothetical protein
MLLVLAFALPAVAQRHRGENHRGGGHENHGNRGGERHEEHRYRGPHYDHHYDGRRFDREYEHERFGYRHRFHVYWEHYGGGLRFQFGGVYFWYQEWPAGWLYTDEVFVDWDEELGCYVLYNPARPNFVFQIQVLP